MSNTKRTWTEGPTADQIYKAIGPSRFQTFWKNSFPSNADCFECGGWFYADPKNKTNLEIVKAPDGNRVPQKDVTTNPAAIDLHNPPGPHTSGWVLVGNFHTHPLAAKVNGNQQPSQADVDLATTRQVPGIVISRRGFFKYGVDARESFTNPGGYPNPSDNPLIRSPRKIPGSGPPEEVLNQWKED